MVDIKLGRGFLLVVAIFAVGYLFIFISVAMDSGDAKHYSEMEAKLVALQNALEHKYGTLVVQNALEKAVPGKPFLEHPNTYTRASRPGVIVLGMHRSGTELHCTVLCLQLNSSNSVSQQMLECSGF
jgi:hypothetical protein